MEQDIPAVIGSVYMIPTNIGPLSNLSHTRGHQSHGGLTHEVGYTDRYKTDMHHTDR